VNNFWPCWDLDLWPVTLNILSSVATRVVVTCAKFSWNASTKWWDIVSHGTDRQCTGGPINLSHAACYSHCTL